MKIANFRISTTALFALASILAAGCQSLPEITERDKAVEVARRYVAQRMTKFGYDITSKSANIIDDGDNWVVEFYPRIPVDGRAGVVAQVSPAVLVRKRDLEVLDFRIDQ
ncbi:hypothetical protein [Inquilinus limosus]|uniref:hypothetical protein n=1 Tax=Inquilinus limosus TaxID=171674 RepID=UPI00126A707D|nr:hypothetical protein [Inquilinus limosus]